MHAAGGVRHGVTMEFFTAELILAYVSLLGALGAGIRFVVVRLDAKQKAAEEAQAAKQKAAEERQEAERTRLEAERVRHELKLEQERLRWEQLMSDQLLALRREIKLQEHEVSHLRDMSGAYLRHILILEGLMRAAGIEIPELKLPIYKPLEEPEDQLAIEVVKPPRRRRRKA